MNVRPVGFALILTGLGLAASCGGRTPDLLLIEGAGAGDDAGPGGSSSGVSSGSGGGSGSGGVSSSSGVASSSGVSSSSGVASSSGSSGVSSSSGISSSSGSSVCSPNGETFGESSGLKACWPCVEKGCQMELSACTQDCTCNSALVSALKCTTTPNNATMCFTELANVQDSASQALIQCLLNVGGECSCTGTPPDASSGCVSTGGSGSGGNGQCTSTSSEMCNGQSYQVVCSCPQGKCVCFGPSTTTIIDYPACPYCGSLPGSPGLTDSELYSLCGFPQ